MKKKLRCPSWPASRWSSRFDALGFGQGFRYFTAVLEIGSAVLLLVPALSGIGALALAIVMVGAILAYVFVLGGSALPAIVLLAATLTIGRLRRAQRPALVRV